MEAEYENAYDFPRQEQFSGTQYLVRWPWFFNDVNNSTKRHVTLPFHEIS